MAESHGGRAGRGRGPTTVRRIRRSLAYAHRRAMMLLAALSAVCLLIAYRCLELIGPPPRLGIEALWVHNRRALVHTLIVSIGVAALASGQAVFAGRQRITVALLWIVGIAVAAERFSDRLPVILRVLIQQVA